ncbi:hypothetical protein HUU62_22355 [Rhodoferax sp. 4810]|nr:hypothetical protein [Rhodoferax jenense]
MSKSIRTFALDAIGTYEPTLAQSARATFRSTLKHRSTPRPLISQLKSAEGTDSPRSPIDAIHHSTIAELRKKRFEILNSDLDQIKEACTKCFNEYLNNCRRLEEIFNDKQDMDLVNIFINRVFFTEIDTVPNWIYQQIPNPITLGSIYIQVINNIPKSPPPTTLNLSFVRVKWIREWIETNTDLPKDLPANVFTYILFGDRELRTACFLCLLVHTGWNSDAVASLTTDRVIGIQPPYQIQGYKSKVNKDTPLVIIEKTDTLECKVLEYLKLRLIRLKNLGLVTTSESRLWINPKNLGAESNRAQTYISHRSDLKLFQHKHGLPLFSPDQVRTQVLALSNVSLMTLDQTRAKAGHVTLDTTSEYLDQHLLRTLNAAINLEFQNRLEQSIIYEENLKKSGDIKSRDLNKSLLFPIGDGASCKDPKKPPHYEYLKGELCSGTNCHLNDGCANRIILLNQNRVEENIRQVKFYLENWKSLSDEYPAAFNKYHLPSMIFALLLHHYISTGPLSHIQSKLENEIQRSQL